MGARLDRVWVVERGFARAHLEDFLRAQLPTVRPLDLRHWIRGGRVRRNGEVCLVNRPLRYGEVVQLEGAELPAPVDVAPSGPEPLPAVTFESETALVIAKPPGLLTVPDRSGKERGLHGRLADLRPHADLRIVHRLDRDTSGCLLLAKGAAAARHFDLEFRSGRVRKTYVALVQGVPAADLAAIAAFLGPDRSRPGKVLASTGARRGFQAAHTELSIRALFPHHALLELRPTTGRSHQLRVHLQSVGHPIVGDSDYGGAPLLLSRLKAGYKHRPGLAERALVERMFLHAERLAFRDLDGREVVVETPLPEDLAVALRQLENFATRRR